jgi:hypothetical protein
VQTYQSGGLYVLPNDDTGASPAAARDDGRFANSPLKPWFDRLASGKGLCCSFADGVTVQDVDWDTQDGHYRVRIYGQWLVVPDVAIVTEPNRFGRNRVCGMQQRSVDAKVANLRELARTG